LVNILSFISISDVKLWKLFSVLEFPLCFNQKFIRAVNGSFYLNKKLMASSDYLLVQNYKRLSL
jgi:hypothetical protein